MKKTTKRELKKSLMRVVEKSNKIALEYREDNHNTIVKYFTNIKQNVKIDTYKWLLHIEDIAIEIGDWIVFDLTKCDYIIFDSKEEVLKYYSPINDDNING